MSCIGSYLVAYPVGLLACRFILCRFGFLCWGLFPHERYMEHWWYPFL